MSDYKRETTVKMGSGALTYDLSDAAIPIRDLIAGLEQAEEDGATHVVGVSGNHRGAQWVRLDPDLDWFD